MRFSGDCSENKFVMLYTYINLISMKAASEIIDKWLFCQRFKEEEITNSDIFRIGGSRAGGWWCLQEQAIGHDRIRLALYPPHSRPPNPTTATSLTCGSWGRTAFFQKRKMSRRRKIPPNNNDQIPNQWWTIQVISPDSTIANNSCRERCRYGMIWKGIMHVCFDDIVQFGSAVKSSSLKSESISSKLHANSVVWQRFLFYQLAKLHGSRRLV